MVNCERNLANCWVEISVNIVDSTERLSMANIIAPI